jgi:uncharacterized protein YjbJ (UPF0337 family)
MHYPEVFMNRFDGLNTKKHFPKNTSSTSTASSNTPTKISKVQSYAEESGAPSDSGYVSAVNTSLKDAIKNDFRPPQFGHSLGHQKQQQQGAQEKQSQQQASLSVAEIKAKWQQNVGSAKVLWGKLTDNEILQTEGHANKLSGLIKERYAISQQEADTQVKKFLTDCKRT